jgi:hypothetical protein
MLALLVMNDRQDQLLRLERIKLAQVDLAATEQIRRPDSIPIMDLEVELGRHPGGDHDLERFVPVGIQRSVCKPDERMRKFSGPELTFSSSRT